MHNTMIQLIAEIQFLLFLKIFNLENASRKSCPVVGTLKAPSSFFHLYEGSCNS